MNRDDRKRLKLAKGAHTKIASHLGVIVDAKQTSTSGRWITMLCTHLLDGLPCFDVINVSVEGQVDRHHFGTVATEGLTYEECRNIAQKEARDLFDIVVAKMQGKASPELKDEQLKGLKVIHPDGTEEDFTVN